MSRNVLLGGVQNLQMKVVEAFRVMWDELLPGDYNMFNSQLSQEPYIFGGFLVSYIDVFGDLVGIYFEYGIIYCGG